MYVSPGCLKWYKVLTVPRNYLPECCPFPVLVLCECSDWCNWKEYYHTRTRHWIQLWLPVLLFFALLERRHALCSQEHVLLPIVLLEFGAGHYNVLYGLQIQR
jgi:hypothetical protein